MFRLAIGSLSIEINDDFPNEKENIQNIFERSSELN